MSKQITITIPYQGRRYLANIPDDITVNVQDKLIVERDNTMEFATCLFCDAQPTRDDTPYNFIRLATPEDDATQEANQHKAQQSKPKILKKIQDNNLQMKLISVGTSFDNSKFLIIYTAEERVDFRALVRDLASLFHTRIEMRQISEREATAIIGGVGTCGQEFCCAKHIRSNGEIGIKMAKIQGLALNPTKINGTCGKLLCCLQYEYDDYKDLQEKMPRLGDTISTPDGTGTVVFHDLFHALVAVKISKDDQEIINKYTLQQLKGGTQ